MRNFIACVASVSSRGSSRKLWQEQKKKRNDGGGGGNPGVICLLCFYFDELSIYKWTEPWNFKGRFPESWGLRASVSSSPLPLQPFFRFRSNFRAITRLETLATQARDVIDLYPLYTRFSNNHNNSRLFSFLYIVFYWNNNLSYVLASQT